MTDKEPGPSEFSKIIRYSSNELQSSCALASKDFTVCFFNNAEKVDKCGDNNGDHENVIDTKHFLDAIF